MVDKVDKKAAVIDVEELEKHQDQSEQIERMRVPMEEQIPGTSSVLGTGEILSRNLELLDLC